MTPRNLDVPEANISLCCYSSQLKNMEGIKPQRVTATKNVGKIDNKFNKTLHVGYNVMFFLGRALQNNKVKRLIFGGFHNHQRPYLLLKCIKKPMNHISPETENIVLRSDILFFVHCSTLHALKAEKLYLQAY